MACLVNPGLSLISFLENGGLGLLDYLAVAYMHDVVGEFDHHGVVGGHNQAGGLVPHHVEHQLHEIVSRLRVEAGRGLVGQ